ncbi:hypothetical protein J6590_019328 [Homalodisca vitripennis]|nr:hypothetical protein J6590_019328 [Homalodisca vitripennis]
MLTPRYVSRHQRERNISNQSVYTRCSSCYLRERVYGPQLNRCWLDSISDQSVYTRCSSCYLRERVYGPQLNRCVNPLCQSVSGWTVSLISQSTHGAARATYESACMDRS